MKQYNEQLVTEGQKIADAWCYEQTPVDLSVLNNEDFAIGYIEIPEMEVRLPLYIGASSDNLAKGAAVLAGTSMPIGGKNTNCVIAAHRGWRGSAYFQMIENLKEGSVVYVTNPWETLTYTVTGTKIVDPTEVSAIMLQEGKDMEKLMKQNYQLSNIEITEGNIKSFEKYARKYGIDFSLKKDRSVSPPRYFVFFKAKDVEVMTAAFKEYTGKQLTKNKKMSVRRKLENVKERMAAHREREKTRQKERGPEH
ncbi:MAG: sortase [Marvinbryantia sp.]